MNDTSNLYTRRFPIFHNGSERIPIQAGTYMTEVMPEEFQLGAFYLAFYNSNGGIITPTGGSIVVEFSPIEGQWHQLNENGTITATTVGASATYTVPTFCTYARQGRMTFDSDIAGGAYCRAFFWRGVNS